MRTFIKEIQDKVSLFYTFDQNNSGGYFDVDKENGIGHYIIIEAYSSDQANDIHERLIENQSSSCGCCGSRWYSCWENDGQEMPMIYGEPVWQKVYNSWVASDPLAYIHYLDGRIEEVSLKEKQEIPDEYLDIWSKINVK